MTAVMPGLAAVGGRLCTCGCDLPAHRPVAAAVYGGCTVHQACREFRPTAGNPAEDAKCGCGAGHGQHYADNGRMRGPRGCQDFHTECTRLCAHSKPRLQHRATGSGEPVVLAARVGGYSPDHGNSFPDDGVPARLLEEPLPPVDEPNEAADAVPAATRPAPPTAPAPAPAPAAESLKPSAGALPRAAAGPEVAGVAAPATSPPRTPRQPRPDTGSRDGGNGAAPAVTAVPPAAITATPRTAARAIQLTPKAHVALDQTSPTAAARRAPRPPARKATTVPASQLADAVRLVVTQAIGMYPAWYCRRCEQRRLDPGACPACHGRLEPVHVLIVPRELA